MCLGFTALFGALFSKTWRVHIIFRDYKLKKTVSNFLQRQSMLLLNIKTGYSQLQNLLALPLLNKQRR